MFYESNNCTLYVKALSSDVIVSFANKTIQDIYEGISSRQSRTIPETVRRVAVRKLDMVDAAHDLNDLRVPPGNRLEILRGDLSGYYSIRVNDQFRIIFRWTSGGAHEVEIIDYHS